MRRQSSCNCIHIDPFRHTPLKVNIVSNFVSKMWRESVKLGKLVEFLHSLPIPKARRVQVHDELVNVAVYATKEHATDDEHEYCIYSFRERVYDERDVGFVQ
jgi:hypothetical protein